jgi:hypothetical protein
MGEFQARGGKSQPPEGDKHRRTGTQVTERNRIVGCLPGQDWFSGSNRTRTQKYQRPDVRYRSRHVRYKIRGPQGPRFEKEFEHIQTHTFDLYPRSDTTKIWGITTSRRCNTGGNTPEHLLGQPSHNFDSKLKLYSTF